MALACQTCGALPGYMHSTGCSDQNVLKFPLGQIVGSDRVIESDEELQEFLNEARCPDCGYVTGNHYPGADPCPRHPHE